MGKSLLIAVGTSSYPHLPKEDQRPQLTEVVQSIVELFTGPLKYRRELKTIGKNPKASTLRKTLDRWFSAEQRDGADWVALYYTGHGEVVGADALYLLTSDYKPGQYVSTAFSLGQLADMVLAKRADGKSPRKIKKLLVIIDVCFAGQGTLQLAQVLSNGFRTTPDSMFYLLGATLPHDEAQAGALAAALIDAVNDLSKRYVRQPFLFFDQLVPAINQRLRLHRAMLSPVLSSSEEPQFFPNPNFIPDIQDAVLANEAQRAITDPKFREHWHPRSPGADPQAGVYFSGRTAVLAKLEGFLKSRDDSATRVVTGRPGAGKSAILSRIVTRANAAYRERTSGLSGETDLPPIDLALDAKGKSAADLTEQFAAFLGVENRIDRVIAAFRSLVRLVRIIIDSLDEATQPDVIAADLLRPCSAIDAVKLLVGTRKEYARALEAAEIIDIDTREHAARADIVQYVESRLLRQHEPGVSSPYAGKRALAHRVAEAVAKKAHPNFLVARLIVEDLLSRPQLVDLRVSDQITFPSTVNRAFGTYLRRFGSNQRRVRDVLLPLAYSEGQGLPWDNIWASLASALARRTYSNGDIKWVLERAGAFILEVADKGRSVYRLYHEALAHYLRSNKGKGGLQKKFVTVLIESVPLRANAAGSDWQLANPYVRTHLAAHAAAAGVLDSLVSDSEFLVTADPASLLRVIDRCVSQQTKAYRDVYIRADLLGCDLPERASYLELVARRSHEDAIADEFARLHVDRRWRVPWVRSLRESTYRNLGRLSGEVAGIAMLPGDETRVAIVRRDENTSSLMMLNVQGEIVFSHALENEPLTVGVAQLDNECILAVFEHRLDMEQPAIESCGYELSISFWSTGDVPRRIRTYRLVDRPGFSTMFEAAAIRGIGTEVVAAFSTRSTMYVVRLELSTSGFKQRETETFRVSAGPLTITEVAGHSAVAVVRAWQVHVYVFDAIENDANVLAMSRRDGGSIGINDDDAWNRFDVPDGVETDATALAMPIRDGGPIALGDSDGTVYILAGHPLSLHYRLVGTGGEITHLDIAEDSEKVTVASVDEVNTVKFWSVTDSYKHTADGHLRESKFSLWRDDARTYLFERSIDMDYNNDRLWTLDREITVYDGPDRDELLQIFRESNRLIPRNHLVFIERYAYRLKRQLSLGGPEQIVVFGPNRRQVGQAIRIAHNRGTLGPDSGYAPKHAEFDLCRIGSRLAILEIDNGGMFLWLSGEMHAAGSSEGSEPWQRRELLSTDALQEDGTRYLLRAYLRSGAADFESTWFGAIARLGVTWARSHELQSAGKSADTIFANNIRIKVMEDFLLIAGGGDSILRIFEARRGLDELSEIVSFNTGEVIQDLEFVGPDRLVVLNSGGSLVVDFTP